MRKGIGPRGLGAPKQQAPNSAAKQTKDYYNLRPSDAQTYADSVAVETSHFSNRGRSMGEIAGKVASGGTLTNQGVFVSGKTPNSANAKKMMEENRALIKKTGGNYKDAYK